MTSQVLYDEDGLVRGLQYHDGYLDGVLLGEDEAFIAIRSLEGQRRVVVLRGLTELHMQDFREGNIVYDLRVLPAASAIKVKEVAQALRERLSLEPSSLDANLFVLLLDSSYGADLVAVCSGVEVGDEGERLEVSQPYKEHVST